MHGENCNCDHEADDTYGTSLLEHIKFAKFTNCSSPCGTNAFKIFKNFNERFNDDVYAIALNHNTHKFLVIANIELDCTATLQSIKILSHNWPDKMMLYKNCTKIDFLNLDNFIPTETLFVVQDKCGVTSHKVSQTKFFSIDSLTIAFIGDQEFDIKFLEIIGQVRKTQILPGTITYESIRIPKSGEISINSQINRAIF